jgi:TIR domain
MPDELTSIFISYARADSPFVDRLEADPHRQGFAPWLDCRGLAGGQQWRRELQEAVDHCQVLLVVLSPMPSPLRMCRSNTAGPVSV